MNSLRVEYENLNPTLPFKILMSNIDIKEIFLFFSSICTLCGVFSVYKLRQMLFLVVSKGVVLQLMKTKFCHFVSIMKYKILRTKIGPMGAIFQLKGVNLSLE